MNANSRILNDHPKTFKVNEFITLKLEGNQTNIYVNGKLFRQCKYILLNIPADKLSKFDEIQSIDEVAEFLDHSQEPQYDEIASQITPKVEFWAHSSNLQAWAENGYDTRLIHRNLAFPLLRKLAEAGEPRAKKAFKEEIARRLENNYSPVLEYLKQEGYLDYLSREEQIYILLEPEEAEALLNIELKKGIEFEIVEEEDLKYGAPPKSRCFAAISNKHVIALEWDNVDINSIIDDILKFSKLQTFDFKDENMVNLPDEMRNLGSLAEIGMRAPKIKQLPDWLLDLKDLRLFVISGASLEREALETVKKMKENGVYVDIY